MAGPEEDIVRPKTVSHSLSNIFRRALISDNVKFKYMLVTLGKVVPGRVWSVLC